LGWKRSQHCRALTELAAGTSPPEEFGTASLLWADTSAANKYIPKVNRQENDSELERAGSAARQQDFPPSERDLVGPTYPTAEPLWRPNIRLPDKGRHQAQHGPWCLQGTDATSW